MEARGRRLFDGKWGQISVPAIAKKLNRTTNAVKVRAQRLGLGAVLMAGEYVTLNQLLLAVTGGSSSYGYKMKSWVENEGVTRPYEEG